MFVAVVLVGVLVSGLLNVDGAKPEPKHWDDTVYQEGCLVGKVREMKTFEKVRGWEVLTWESCREKCQDNEDCEEFRFKNHWSPRRRACFLMKEDLQCKEDWVSGSRNCKMPDEGYTTYEYEYESTTPEDEGTTYAPCTDCYFNFILRNSQDNSPMSTETTITLSHPWDMQAAQNIGADGLLSIAVMGVGLAWQYEVTVSSPGFIDSVFTMYIECSDDGSCTEANKFVSMSPELAPGQTRIMLTWATDAPSDLDIHIMAVNKADGSTCRTHWADTQGCDSISLDLDNTSGGLNGAETMTLTDNTVNQNYVYIIGVEDYGFENAGADFLQSGAIVTITNGQNTDATALVADSVSADAEFYMFGCVTVDSAGGYTYVAAPEGTWFDGHDDGTAWTDMMTQHCSSILSRTFRANNPANIAAAANQIKN